MRPRKTVKYKEHWSEAEFVITLYLYFNTEPKERNADNSCIIETARVIGRTPASVVYRLGNYSAVDPNSCSKGFTHGGKLTKKMFEKYSINKDPMAELAKNIRSKS